MRIRWFVGAFFLGLFGLRANGGVPVPEIVAIGRTSPATLDAPGTLNLAFERTGENGAAINLLVSDVTGATKSTLERGPLHESDAGNHTVRVSNTRGTTTSPVFTPAVAPSLEEPAISRGPSAQVVTAGKDLVLSVQATGSDLIYIWRRNGAIRPGGTSATLPVALAADLVSAGTYRVQVSNFLGTVTSHTVVVEVAVPPAAVSSRLLNVSVLTSVAGANNRLSWGYVVGGAGTAGTKPLLIRAVGPSQAAFGVGGVLPDLRPERVAGATKTDENDNWGGLAARSAAMARVGAVPLVGATSKDAATSIAQVTTDNTVRIASADGQPGVVLAELYDATPAAEFTHTSRRLLDIAVLKGVGGGVTADFVISGDASKSVLVRAVGPALGQAPFEVRYFGRFAAGVVQWHDSDRRECR